MVKSGSVYTKALIFFGLLIIAIGFHSLHLTHASYELDEAIHIWYAQQSYAEVLEHASNDPNPPVYLLAISAWVKTFGVSEASTRSFSVLMGALAVAAIFVIGSRNFGLAVGIMAALFLCFSPVLFRFTHLARPYSMLMLSVVLSYGALFESLKYKGVRNLIVYYLATTLMIYVHPTSIFNVLAQAMIILWAYRKNMEDVFRLMVPLVSAVVSFAIWMVTIPYFERDDRMWFGPPTWDDAWNVLQVLHGHWSIVLAQLILLVIIVVKAVRGSKISRAWILVAFWCVVPFVSSILFSLFIKPVFQDKYMLSVQPALMLLLAITIGILFKEKVFLKMVTAAGIVVILAFSTEIKPRPNGGDWKGVVDYLQPIHDGNNAIFIDPSYEFATFAYYYNRHSFETYDQTVSLLQQERIFTDWANIYDREYHLPEYETVHLVLAHQSFAGAGVNPSHLDSVARLISEKQFNAILVKTYAFLPAIPDSSVTRKHDFSALENGVKVITEQTDYSDAVVIPLRTFGRRKPLFITASVYVRSFTAPQDIKLVSTVEHQDIDPMPYYNLTHLPGVLPEDTAWVRIEHSFTLEDYDPRCVVKLYVWNEGGQRFEMDSLELSIHH